MNPKVHTSRIASSRTLRPAWIYTIEAGSHAEAEDLIREQVHSLGSNFEGRKIEGLSYQLLSLKAKPVLQWFMDIILGSESPRIFTYEVTLHLTKLGKASPVIEGPEQIWENHGTQTHPHWQPVQDQGPNS